MNDTARIVDNAIGHGWEAGIVAVLILGSMGLLAWLFRFMIVQSQAREEALWRQSAEREQRLAKRIDDLETFINQTLVSRIEGNTMAMEQLRNSIDTLNTMMERRPCLLPDELISKVKHAINGG